MQMELNKDTECRDLERSFFLFVNSGSGGTVGALLLQQEVRMYLTTGVEDIIQNEESHRCNVYIYNMRANKDAGFKRLKLQSEKHNQKCYAIVCGGDGTVMWVVSEMVAHDIKVLTVPIGVIPMGTGNDFSRELGWGSHKSSLLDSGFKSLKKEIRNWIYAKEEYFDIWDVEAQVFEDGKFQKVEEVQNVTLAQKVFRKTFCNYFSFGIDGKIGYSFDSHRTKSRLGNLAMYGCMGVIKTMTKTKNLDQLLDSIQIKATEQDKDKQSLKNILAGPMSKTMGPTINRTMSASINNSNTMNGSISETFNMSTNVFNASERKKVLVKCESSMRESSMKEDNSQSGGTELKKFSKNYYNILALNINSYTGGVTDIWDKAKNGFIKGYSRNMEYSDISTGDGKLQIVSFGSTFGIALQRVFGGFSKKVAQGEGPFVFNFHRYENLPKHRTYLQIDGQFIRFTQPKIITITKSQLTPMSKIKVLRSQNNN